MIFRWAVIALPLVGTVALLRPASAGLKRIGNAVVASIFNILIFGAGAAVYLLAVDVITSTSSLAGWLQVVLIGLCGLAGWILLRPYQRLTQLGGGSGGDAGTLRDRLLGRSRSGPDQEESQTGPETPGHRVRPETRADSGILVANRAESAGPSDDGYPEPRRSQVEVRHGTAAGADRPVRTSDAVTRPASGDMAGGGTTHPQTARDEPIGYQIYVPDSRRRPDSAPDYDVSEAPETSRPLFIPEEWRDEYVDRP
jgi:hypothetical protein